MSVAVLCGRERAYSSPFSAAFSRRLMSSSSSPISLTAPTTAVPEGEMCGGSPQENYRFYLDHMLSDSSRERGGGLGHGQPMDIDIRVGDGCRLEEEESELAPGLISACKVCGDQATGMYFGAMVCVPCKTFFLRYAGDGFSFVCKYNKACEISMANRTQCKYCRYQKCIEAGMKRRVRPAHVQLSEGQQICCICNDVANGIHFGCITCEGCKKFFRRGLVEHATYVCKNGETCVINPRTRNTCRLCRYKKCLVQGMSRDAIQMGRPSKMKYDRDPGTGYDQPCDSYQIDFTGVGGGGGGSGGGHSGNGEQYAGGPMVSHSLALPPFSSQNSAGSIYEDMTSMQRVRASSFNIDRQSRPSLGIDRPIRPGLLGFSGGVLDVQQSRLDNSFNSLSSELSHDCKGTGLQGSSFITRSNISDGRTNSSMTAGQSVTSSTYPIPNFSQNWNEKMELLSLFDSHKQSSSRHGEQPLVMKTEDDTMTGYENAQSSDYGQTISLKTEDPSVLKSESLSTNTSTADIYHRRKCVSLSDSNHPFGFSMRGSGEESIMSNVEPSALRRVSEGGGSQLAMILRGSYDNPSSDSELSLSRDLRDCGGGPLRLSSNHLTLGGAGNTTGQPYIQPRRQTMPEKDMRSFGSGDGTKLARNSIYSPPSSSTGGGIDRFGTCGNWSPTARQVDTRSPGSCSSGSGGWLRDTTSPYESLMELTYKWRHLVTAAAGKSDNSLTGSMDIGDRDESHDGDSGGGGVRGNGGGVLSDEALEQQLKVCEKYWLSGGGGEGEGESSPGREEECGDDSIFEKKYRDFVSQTMACYERFVQTSTKINRRLAIELKNWDTNNHQEGQTAPENTESPSLPEWIQKQVVPVYTLTSITYCRNLVGFKTFDTNDQQTLIRLGQSPSRILVAAVHWFNPKTNNFDDFLSWRTDLFKDKLVACASEIHKLELDQVEAAMLNALIVIASDYPGLTNPGIIEEARKEIIRSFNAYITAKLGMPNNRMQCLFRQMIEVRRLGFLHYKMTKTHNLRAEECTKS